MGQAEERGEERGEERARERASERARERESERKRARERERERERDSESERERVKRGSKEREREREREKGADLALLVVEGAKALTDCQSQARGLLDSLRLGAKWCQKTPFGTVGIWCVVLSKWCLVHGRVQVVEEAEALTDCQSQARGFLHLPPKWC